MTTKRLVHRIHQTLRMMPVMAACAVLINLTLAASADEVPGNLQSQFDKCKTLTTAAEQQKCTQAAILDTTGKSGSEGLGFGDPGTMLLCHTKWGDDFEMEAYCRETQFNDMNKFIWTLVELKKTENPSPAIVEKIRRLCVQKWRDDATDAIDWSMTLYCFDNQMKAAKKLGY